MMNNNDELFEQVNKMVAEKKRLYSNIDITTSMSEHEKQLNKDIASIYSQIFENNRLKRAAQKANKMT